MLLRCRCRVCPVGQTLTAHAGRVPTRRLLYSTRTRTPWEKHEARGQLVEGSRCRGFKRIRAGGKACAHAFPPARIGLKPRQREPSTSCPLASCFSHGVRVRVE